MLDLKSRKKKKFVNFPFARLENRNCDCGFLVWGDYPCYGYCYRTKFGSEAVMCTECNQKSVRFHLEGVCLIGSCSCCGLTFVGASFSAACENDNDEYRILLRNSNVEKRTLVKLAKILNYNVLEFMREVNAGKVLSLGYSLRQIVKLLSFLEDNAIAYEIVPPLPYSKIRYCTYWNF